MKSKTTIFLFFLGVFFMMGCQSIPKNATAVSPFSLDKYLGKWYELARLDFKYEEGLNNTTATYSMKDNGNVEVLNQGYDYEKKEWTEAKGRAKFRGENNVAELKVSFFGPFWAGYNVISLAGDYEYALVAGKDTDFLWILARTTTIPDNIRNGFLQEAKKIGYNTDELIWVEHDKN